MTVLLTDFAACSREDGTQEDFHWVADRFDDIKVLRYQVPGFDELPLEQKKLIYYLSEAALSGRDIIFDQNFRYNLLIRRTLESIYAGYSGNREEAQWDAFEKYLKKVWFANGIHHHYSNDKFIPEFTEAYFDKLLEETPANFFPDDCKPLRRLVATIKPILFDPALYPKRLNQADSVDMLQASAMNYYQGATQVEAEKFYAAMADPNNTRPVSYGLNSQLVKESGHLTERVWREGGMYGAAIEKIVFWLRKAAEVAEPQQRRTIESLIAYYKSGNLKKFDEFNILWVQDTASVVDFVNGFTEVYGDPLGYKGAWEGLVNFKNIEATRRTEIISSEAQWFEDHSPVDSQYRKSEVKGISAKVITVAMLSGDCYPATPIGINLPNSDWIRKEYGSKSVTIENITYAYDASSKGSGFLEEFMLRSEDRDRIKRYGYLADNIHTDLHECLGHGSGQLAPGVKGDELKNYGSALEEARADLFALYYIADPRMIELGVLPSEDAAKAEYAKYIMNGMMTQLVRIRPGKEVEQAHMRNRKLISEWCYEHGKAENVIEKVVRNGKTYVVVNDFGKLRALFGELLREVQRIKSKGDFEAGRALVENYGIKIDSTLHAEVLARYEKLHMEPYAGFINPEYLPVMENGEIVDIKLRYQTSYAAQMMDYAKNYSFLPSENR